MLFFHHSIPTKDDKALLSYFCSASNQIPYDDEGCIGSDILDSFIGSSVENVVNTKKVRFEKEDEIPEKQRVVKTKKRSARSNALKASDYINKKDNEDKSREKSLNDLLHQPSLTNSLKGKVVLDIDLKELILNLARANASTAEETNEENYIELLKKAIAVIDHIESNKQYWHKLEECEANTASSKGDKDQISSEIDSEGRNGGKIFTVMIFLRVLSLSIIVALFGIQMRPIARIIYC